MIVLPMHVNKLKMCFFHHVDIPKMGIHSFSWTKEIREINKIKNMTDIILFCLFNELLHYKALFQLILCFFTKRSIFKSLTFRISFPTAVKKIIWSWVDKCIETKVRVLTPGGFANVFRFLLFSSLNLLTIIK